MKRNPPVRPVQPVGGGKGGIWRKGCRHTRAVKRRLQPRVMGLAFPRHPICLSGLRVEPVI
ncbi:unnamed protein product [Tetraodon nigroviridis]|uniref:(spotted green pufferfish) hypothetical protein n=1 Tax=Tetraodon nigroviridis TaxID=99883 RepID=Q4S3G2_TETNG|nr:unnamed protein product [Tetraodon nigroviridis]